jgi:hypothetical protein
MSSVKIMKDLRSKLGEAREQGARPTCLAFATSDAHSFAIGEPWNPLSCEYLFYHAKKGDGSMPGGTNVTAIATALKAEGQPVEADWPYLTTLPSDLSTWTPPSTVGQLYRADVTQFKSPNVVDVWNIVESGTPAIVGITLSAAFYSWDSEGVIDSDEPAETARRHALLVVATGLRNAERMLLVRNSWGTTWGISGHGWLSERYLKPRLIVSAKLQSIRVKSAHV